MADRLRVTELDFDAIKQNLKAFGLAEDDLDEACWKGYKQVGGKKKGNKMVPNCVPKGK